MTDQRPNPYDPGHKMHDRWHSVEDERLARCALRTPEAKAEAMAKAAAFLAEIKAACERHQLALQDDHMGGWLVVPLSSSDLKCLDEAFVTDEITDQVIDAETAK